MNQVLDIVILMSVSNTTYYFMMESKRVLGKYIIKGVRENDPDFLCTENRVYVLLIVKVRNNKSMYGIRATICTENGEFAFRFMFCLKRKRVQRPCSSLHLNLIK